MGEKGKYRTHQKEELLDYLASIPGTHFTVADVCAYFREQGKSIGTTTVYRQLEQMVNEGLVNKYIIDANTPACFEYTGLEEHSGEETCFHCKCERCGRLTHLHCDEMKLIEGHLLEHHGFRWNPYRTVFYGLCEECSREG